MKEIRTQNELNEVGWSAALAFKGKADVPFLRSVILSLFFYKYISYKIQQIIDNEYNGEADDYAEAIKNNDVRDDIVNRLGYIIEPGDLFSAQMTRLQTHTFKTSNLADAFKRISSSGNAASKPKITGIFNSAKLNAVQLGRNEHDRIHFIKNFFKQINKIPMIETENISIGKTFEFLIKNYALRASKSSGEFFTPQEVSEIMVGLIQNNMTAIKSVYDPTIGSGSLVLKAGNYLPEVDYYGQEIDVATYNVARMNMIIHDIPYKNYDLELGNTIERPLIKEDVKVDAVVSSPPFSEGWSSSPGMLEDPRYRDYGRLAPKSKSDFAFILDGLSHLDEAGMMSVMVPKGVLFRKAAEQEIRRRLIQKKNYLDAVIVLPENLLYGTRISTAILVFKKNRKASDKVMFIDAENEFKKIKRQNYLQQEHINKIIDTYSNGVEINHYSRLVDLKEISDNQYNLNITRYINNYVPEKIDVAAETKQFKDNEKLLSEVNLELDQKLKDYVK